MPEEEQGKGVERDCLQISRLVPLGSAYVFCVVALYEKGFYPFFFLLFDKGRRQ